MRLGSGRTLSIGVIAVAFLLSTTTAGPIEVEFVLIPADIAQPNGPTHDFRLGRFEITNEQFVRFLNDAQENLSNPRGQYMYFDISNGDVYVHSTMIGAVGATPAGLTVKMFSPASSGRIARVNGHYEVDQNPIDFALHPVTGVSWYGAVKYCNWLTLEAGLDLSQRAYSEAPAGNLAGWRPATISTPAWSIRDLNESERAALLSLPGFRLPMDGGSGGLSPGRYNEWFKAAAWDAQAGVNRLYGFGRDSITMADANYRCSFDPFENVQDCLLGGTTPIGFYDGSNHGGGFTTQPNANTFGAYDLSGNVWEWLQDQSTSPVDRRNRGGSHRSAPVSLQVGLSAERPAESVNDSTGFRVVQSIPSPFLVSSPSQVNLSGVWGGPLLPEEGPTYCATNLSESEIQYSVYTDSPWITLSGGHTEGTLASLATVAIAADVDFDCELSLPIGTHTATILFEDMTNQILVARSVQLTLTEPLSLTPTTNLTAGMAYGATPTPQSLEYTLTSQSESAVQWSVTWTETGGEPTGVDWISLSSTGGSLSSSEPVAAMTVMLHPESLSPGTHTASVIWRNDCTNSTFTRAVTLTIVPPLTVSHGSLASNAICNGPFQPDSHNLTLANPNAMPVSYEVSMPDEFADLVELVPSSGVVGAGSNVGVSVRILGHGSVLSESPLTVPITISHPQTGYSVTRNLALSVGQLIVDPPAALLFVGPLGGPFEPGYTLVIHNYGVSELTWSASFEETSGPPSGTSWLSMAPSVGTILNPQGVGLASIEITYDAKSMAPGVYTGVLQISTDYCSTTRPVTFEVGAESFRIPMTNVRALPQQPDGPNYDFRIGRYEVTNQAFARFLNDALRNADNARGAFLAHHPAQRRLTLAGDGTLLFDGAVGNDLVWMDGRYHVPVGRELFPVTGVTWFGALKFCNWLTLVHGMDSPDQRAYHEGANRNDWYPVTTSSIIYANLDLTPAQRNQLVADVRGYRLPMDFAGAGAAAYNEWYKAAAWRPATGTHSTYGFGRNSLTNADANFKNSCDPFEPTGASPVGFYDGQAMLQGNCGATAPTSNAFGIYDMTGNVSEWLQDFGVSALDRATRGGHFENLQNSPNLTNTVRVARPPDQALATTGFRIAQTLTAQTPIVSVDAIRLSGPTGGPFDRSGFELSVENPADYAMDGVSVSTSAGWLTSSSPSVPVIPPDEARTLSFGVSTNPALLGVSPSPGSDFTLIPLSDAQPGGPAHDFWIGHTEVTNVEYADFLNNARANALSASPDARSHHMYFDLDSGSVYINDKEVGEEGNAAPGAFLFFLLYDAQLGRIRFNGQVFVPESGYENHPVVGVSWYGAVKYCNWRTIAAGISPALRAYVEAPSPLLSNWRPAVMDDIEWIRDGVHDGHRAAMIEETLGYRLPMDGGAEGAAPFNEWHKAAAWNPNDDRVYTYGFGRDELNLADANYGGAPASEAGSTTPVRFYNGSSLIPVEPDICPDLATPPARTRASANAYALFDMTGNVAEWTQELGPTFADRITRGGSWRDSEDSEFLTTIGRRGLAGHHAYDDVGFRVVRGTGRQAQVNVVDAISGATSSVALVVDTREALRVDPRPDVEIEVMLGQSPVEPVQSYVVQNESLAPMTVQISSNASWLVLESVELPALTGVMDPEAELSVSAAVLSANLAPGMHAATVTVTNQTTGRSIVRRVRVKVVDPLELVRLTPDPQQFEGIWMDEFTSPLPIRSYRITNLHPQTLSFVASASVPWMTVGPQGALSGLLLPNESRTLSVQIGSQALELAVARHSGALNLQLSAVHSPSIGWSRSEAVTVVVHDPLSISPSADVWDVGPHLSSSTLPVRVFTLVNNHDAPLEVTAASDVPWISLSGAQWELAPGQEVQLAASITAQALLLHHGSYAGRITFQTLTTGSAQCRPVNLHVVERLSVDPFLDFVAAGTPGGMIDPLGRTYAISNVSPLDGPSVAWTAVVQPTTTAWVLVNGGSSANGVLVGGQSTSLLVSINPLAVMNLTEGIHEAEVQVHNETDNETVVRKVRLTLSVPAFVHAERPVSPSVAQPLGPNYAFRMSRFHTTNSEFVEFLNDAMLNPADERGQHMYFDLDTGNVYVNTIMNGEFGHGANGRTTRLFTCYENGPIQFNGDVYSVAATPINFASHPVTGVSWYGAVKYANWLTIDQGLLPSQRCCLEDVQSNLAGWRPATISASHWLTRDLNDAERSALIQNYRGFRLPMDDGHNNANPAVDTADDFNEWYKVAAWNAALNQNSLYGFGRGTLTSLDANYLNSGDPFDNGTTPVGFFGGPNQIPSFPANANGNSFDVYDMSGNAYQWILGRYNSNANSLAFRTLRGGSWNDAANSSALRTNARTFTTPALTDPLVGFRVVRTLPPANGDLNGDGHTGLGDFALSIGCFGGPGQLNPLTCAAFDFDADDDFDLIDLRQYQLGYSQGP